MKHIKILFILTLIFTFTSCGSDHSAESKSNSVSDSNLIGAWVLDEVSVGDMKDASEAEREMMKKMMAAMKGKMKFIFNEDGSTSVESNLMGNIDIKVGKYHIDGNKIVITETENGDQEMNYFIKNQKLHLSHSEGGQEISMVLTKK